MNQWERTVAELEKMAAEHSRAAEKLGKEQKDALSLSREHELAERREVHGKREDSLRDQIHRMIQAAEQGDYCEVETVVYRIADAPTGLYLATARVEHVTARMFVVDGRRMMKGSHSKQWRFSRQDAYRSYLRRKQIHIDRAWRGVLMPMVRLQLAMEFREQLIEGRISKQCMIDGFVILPLDSPFELRPIMDFEHELARHRSQMRAFITSKVHEMRGKVVLRGWG